MIVVGKINIYPNPERVALVCDTAEKMIGKTEAGRGLPAGGCARKMLCLRAGK